MILELDDLWDTEDEVPTLVRPVPAELLAICDSETTPTLQHEVPEELFAAMLCKEGLP